MATSNETIICDDTITRDDALELLGFILYMMEHIEEDTELPDVWTQERTIQCMKLIKNSVALSDNFA